MADISATLVSNSTQLDNVDLMGGARVFTITSVTVHDGAEQVMSIGLAEYPRPWKPGLTMRRLLAEMYGADDDNWIGKRVRLYRDEKVSFGRDKTGGTRISHASDLAKTIVVTLPTSKGKFGEFKVEPLVEAPKPDTATVAAKAIDWFATKNVPQSSLEAHVGKPVAEWTDADIAELKSNADTIVGAA
jgi:hypothetical protein